MEGTWIEPLREKSIAKEICVMKIDDNLTQQIKIFILYENSWMTKKRQKNLYNISKYVLIDDHLYGTMCNWPLLKHVSLTDRHYVLREIHEGICGSHIRTKALVKIWYIGQL